MKFEEKFFGAAKSTSIFTNIIGGIIHSYMIYNQRGEYLCLFIYTNRRFFILFLGSIADECETWETVYKILHFFWQEWHLKVFDFKINFKTETLDLISYFVGRYAYFEILLDVLGINVYVFNGYKWIREKY